MIRIRDFEFPEKMINLFLPFKIFNFATVVFSTNGVSFFLKKKASSN